MGITTNQANFLLAIKELGEMTLFNYVATREIIKYFKDKYTDKIVRIYLSQLKREDLLENPVRGGWRLSQIGKKVLNDLTEN